MKCCSLYFFINLGKFHRVKYSTDYTLCGFILFSKSTEAVVPILGNIKKPSYMQLNIWNKQRFPSTASTVNRSALSCTICYFPLLGGWWFSTKQNGHNPMIPGHWTEVPRAAGYSHSAAHHPSSK